MYLPFFSIIIPTFNSSKTIKNCIESVLHQSFTDFEILIIDALSSDNTLSLIQSFDDHRIKVISEKDDGIYDAMNKGIRHSSGKWLYFLGSDDELYEKWTLNEIFKFQQLNDSKKIIYGNVLIKGHTLWAKNNQKYDGLFGLKKLLQKNICHQSIFYNRNVFRKKQYNIKYNICADWDVCFYAYSKYKFAYIDLIIAKFNGGGVSTTLNDVHFGLDRWNNIIHYFGLCILSRAFWPYSDFIYLEAKKDHLFIIRVYYYFYIKYIRNK